MSLALTASVALGTVIVGPVIKAASGVTLVPNRGTLPESRIIDR